MNNNRKLYFLSSCVFLSLGMISGYLSHAGDNSWYQSLIKPYFNPPSWIFSPIWTILYIMLGVTFVKLWQQRNSNQMALYLFVFQFALNLAWSPLFFGLHRIDLAFINIIVMWLSTIFVLILSNNKIRALMLPYLFWISFATLLNYEIYYLNIISIF